MFINHRSTNGIEGVTWGSSMTTLGNRNHTKENFGCRVLMAYNVQRYH
jgi:hypothetical protein